MKICEVDQIPILLGKRMRILRKARKLSQGRLAKKAGMLETAYQRIEGGKTNPTIKTLQKIANGLGVHISELLIHI